MSTHSKKAAAFIADSERAAWHDRALWHVRSKRDDAAGAVGEWEELRSEASEIKRHTLSHLVRYLEEFESNARKNGINLHWAEDAAETNEAVYGILKERGIRKLLKSKSMLSEECRLNAYLAERGVEVMETDLGERIMQLMDSPPSHIVMPAIHVRREEIAGIFAEKLGTDPANCDPGYLTRQARERLREEFMFASAAMTGVNFAVARDGSFVVCTNEGNADMGTSFADVHIAIMGIDKVIPDYRSLGVFTRLLARSATGQNITTYTSVYRRPVTDREIHLIIVDNGRSRSLADSSHRNMLKCMRCGACINTCPVYRRSGGYSYSYFIPGPVGINLGMLASPHEHSGNLSACTLCRSCSGVCPARIDLAEQIYGWRQTLDGMGLADPAKKMTSKGIGALMRSHGVFRMATEIAPAANLLPHFVLHNRLNPYYGGGRDMPRFARTTFEKLWKHGKTGLK